MELTNLKEILSEIQGGNCFNEKVYLVGATKMVDYQTINLAIEQGLKIVAENKVQEYREKHPFIKGAFISFKVKLFNCNFSACFFKLFFDSFSFCFANAFFDNLWSCCNKVFSFFKTKSCKFTYSFDYWYTRTFC